MKNKNRIRVFKKQQSYPIENFRNFKKSVFLVTTQTKYKQYQDFWFNYHKKYTK